MFNSKLEREVYWLKKNVDRLEKLEQSFYIHRKYVAADVGVPKFDGEDYIKLSLRAVIEKLIEATDLHLIKGTPDEIKGK